MIQHCPTPTELDDLELLVSGAYAPLTRFNERGSVVTLDLPDGATEAELVDPDHGSHRVLGQLEAERRERPFPDDADREERQRGDPGGVHRHPPRAEPAVLRHGEQRDRGWFGQTWEAAGPQDGEPPGDEGHDHRHERDDEAAARVAVDAHPAEQAAWREEIERALSLLDAEQREAFLLKHVEGLSYEEMAAITGVGVSALKMRVKRACERLQRLLREVSGVE